jgi:hypothetical protein
MMLLFAVAGLTISGRTEWGSYEDNTRPYKDAWGNSYKHQENLYKDTDHDGVINLYDYNDRNPNVQYRGQFEIPTTPYKSRRRY